MRFVCAFLLLGLWFAAPAAADDLEDGRLAYYNFEYELAMGTLRPLAEQGDPTAQLYVGLMYSLGRGVPVDRIEAYAWFNLAATGDIPMAPYYQSRMRDGMSAAQLHEVENRSRLYWEKYVEPFQ